MAYLDKVFDRVCDKGPITRFRLVAPRHYGGLIGMDSWNIRPLLECRPSINKQPCHEQQSPYAAPVSANQKIPPCGCALGHNQSCPCCGDSSKAALLGHRAGVFL